MWPILGLLESNRTHRSINFNHVQRSLFGGKSAIVSRSHKIDSNNQPSSPIIPIKSNIRYIDPTSSKCLLIYTLILLLLCALPIFALNIYLPQAFDTFYRRSPMQINQFVE